MTRSSTGANISRASDSASGATNGALVDPGSASSSGEGWPGSKLGSRASGFSGVPSGRTSGPHGWGAHFSRK